MNINRLERINNLVKDWEANPRWSGIARPYSAAEVVRLSGTVRIDHTLASVGSRRFWEMLQGEGYVGAMGAMTGNQAIQQVQAGLKAIYLSGWQVAAESLVPDEKQAEFFGLYSFSGKVSSLLGPLVYGSVVARTGNHRLAMTSIIAFFVVGGFILLFVREREGMIAAGRVSG